MIIKSNWPIWAIILMSIEIYPLFAQQTQDSTKVTVAVIDFKNNSGVFRYDRLERTIPELLKTELSLSTDILVVERNKIESILKEQALAQAGVLATEAAQQVGRLAGAEYIITGEINYINGTFRIDAHLIKVSTGQVSGEKVTSYSDEYTELMIKMLAQNIIFNLTGKGERQQSFKLRDYRARWAGAGMLALAAATAFFHMKYHNEYDRYHQMNLFGDFDQAYDNANRFYRARNISLVGTIAAAVVTVVLWKNDRDKENRIYAGSVENNFPIQGMAMKNDLGTSIVSITIQW